MAIIGLSLGISMAGPLWVANAQGGVAITGQIISCDSAEVTYQVFGTGAPNSTISAYNGDSQLLGSTTGPASDGTHTVTVSFPAQPVGTEIHVVVISGEAYAVGPSEPCYSTGGGGGASPGASAPSWAGYSDGRLNPDPTEYYSVWCAFDRVEVWGGAPQVALLGTIPINDLLGLTGSFDAGNGLTVSRVGDTVTISGSNGNSAPEPGSKSFSLSECIARNGGLPASEPPPAPESEAPQEEPSPVEFCMSLTGADLIDCLSSVGGLSSLQTLWLWIAQFCLGGLTLVLAIPGGLWWWRRRRSRKRTA